MSKRIENLKKAITTLENKEHKFVFLIPDTQGIARASVSITYHHALMLHKQGFNVVMLHEKEDYMNVSSWLTEEYDKLEHTSIESNKLEVSAADFLIIPEIYGNVVEKVEHLPCQKIVFVQSIEHMLDTYSPGKFWLDYNVMETMTTSDEAKMYLEDLLHVANIKVVPIGVSENFKPYEKLKKPIVAIHCKETRKTAKILKMFYLRYPYLRWVAFRDMHSMTYEDFAYNLKESIVAVWSDKESTFPLFLLESLKCNVPVIAQIPTLLHEWTTDEVASWAMTDMEIVELIAMFVKSWLEDNVPSAFDNVHKSVEDKFTYEQMEESIKTVYGEYTEERIKILNQMIEQLKEMEKAEENEGISEGINEGVSDAVNDTVNDIVNSANDAVNKPEINDTNEKKD